MQENKCQMCDQKLDFQNTLNLQCGHQMILCLDCLMNISEKDQCKNCSQKPCCSCHQQINKNKMSFITLQFEDCKQDHKMDYCNDCFQQHQKKVMSSQNKICFLCKVNLQKSKLLYYTDKLDCDKNHIVNLCGNCNQIFSKTKKRCLECKPLDIAKKYCIACNNEIDFEMKILPILCNSKYHKFNMCLDCTDKLENPYLICNICQQKEETNATNFQICENTAEQKSLAVLKFISNDINQESKVIDQFCCPICNPVQISPYFLTNVLDDQKLDVPIMSKSIQLSSSQFIITGGYDTEEQKSMSQCLMINFFKDGRFRNFEINVLPHNLNKKRHAHGCYYDQETKTLYIFGGINKPQSLTIEYLDSIEILDFSGFSNKQQNQKVQSMKLDTPRADFQQFVYDNKIYLIGGFSGINKVNKDIQEIDFKNYQTRNIKIQSDIDIPYKPCILINDDSILMLGGTQSGRSVDTILELDLRDKKILKKDQKLKNQPKNIKKVNFKNTVLLYGGKFNNEDDCLKFATFELNKDIIFNKVDMSRIDIDEKLNQENEVFFDNEIFDFGFNAD